jgi:hypothetical protein
MRANGVTFQRFISGMKVASSARPRVYSIKHQFDAGTSEMG